MLKHILVFVNFYCSKTYFLKKANFLQICISEGIGQLYRETVNIKNISNIKIYIFFSNNFIDKMALGLCIQFIDLLIRRNIEQTPRRLLAGEVPVRGWWWRESRNQISLPSHPECLITVPKWPVSRTDLFKNRPKRCFF